MSFKTMCTNGGFLFFVLLVCCFSIEAKSKTGVVCEASNAASCYYASPNGSGVGSYSDPASLEDALALGAVGDYIYLRGGSYTEHVTIGGVTAIMNLSKFAPRATPFPTADRPLTITGYPGEEVVVQGDFTARCVAIDRRSHYVFSHFKVERCLNEGIRLGLDIPQEDVLFDQIEISQIRYLDNSGFLTIHSYKNVRVQNSVFHDYDSPIFPSGNGFYLKLFQAIDVLIENNEFYGDGSGIYYKHGEALLDQGGFTRIYNNVFRDLTEMTAIRSNQNRTEIKGNLILDASVGLHYEDGTQAIFTQEAAVEFNTIINGSINLNQGSDNYIPGVQLGVFDGLVKNNILLNSDYRIWQYGPDEQFNLGVGLDSDQNCFFNESSGFMVNYFGASGSWGNLGDVYSFNDWQLQGFDGQSIHANPLLNVAHEPDSGSPCQGKGHTAFFCQLASSSHPNWLFCDAFEGS